MPHDVWWSLHGLAKVPLHHLFSSFLVALPNSLRKMTRNSFSTSSSLFKSPTASTCLPVLLWGLQLSQHQFEINMNYGFVWSSQEKGSLTETSTLTFFEVQFLSAITFNVCGLYFGLRKFSLTHYRTLSDKLHITSWIFRISTLKIICSSIEQVG